MHLEVTFSEKAEQAASNSKCKHCMQITAIKYN